MEEQANGVKDRGDSKYVFQLTAFFTRHAIKFALAAFAEIDRKLRFLPLLHPPHYFDDLQQLLLERLVPVKGVISVLVANLSCNFFGTVLFFNQMHVSRQLQLIAVIGLIAFAKTGFMFHNQKRPIRQFPDLIRLAPDHEFRIAQNSCVAAGVRVDENGRFLSGDHDGPDKDQQQKEGQ